MNDGRRLRTIITSTAAVIFCLFASFTGTYAWFITNTKAQMETSAFVLTAEDASIESVLLYKFEYNKISGIIDYLSPEDGTVNIYSFNEEEGKFGTGTGEGFEPVSVMNLYDPVNLAITDNELFDLNCNVIFKITMVSSSMGSASVKVFADRLIEKTKETNEIFLSDCADFDLFLPADLSDASLITEEYKNYYPSSYKSQSDELTDAEEVYYKLSFLSSKKASHANFYDSIEIDPESGDEVKPEQVPIHNPASLRTITFDESGKAVIYVNVNYAESQLSHYVDELVGDTKVTAIFDYALTVTLVS